MHGVIRKFLSDGTTKSKRGGAKPKKLNEDQENEIKSWIDQDYSILLKKIKNLYIERFSVNVSKSTI